MAIHEELTGEFSVRRKVTMQQIADMAGVSKFAVSRALSGKSGVSEQTREYIIKIAGDLGFFRNVKPAIHSPQLSASATHRPETVLVLFPNIRYQNTENTFWGVIFDSISQKLDENGLTIVTLTQVSKDSLASLLNPEMILGVISVGMVSTQMLLEVQSMKLPLVMIDHIDPALHCDGIFVDNYFMMKQLVVKLIGRGYQTFQFVGKVNYSFSFEERWRAFKDSLNEYNIEHRQNTQLMCPEVLDEYDSVMAIPDEELPQVFVCANDAVALRVYDALKQRGLRIPEDCAVTGFDDTVFKERIEPGLTSVHVPKEVMGERAVEMLLYRVRNREQYYSKLMLTGEVIVRESIL